MSKDKVIRIFKEGQIERIAKILGDTENGLTGSEIGHTLEVVGVHDIDSLNTKWKRLYNALGTAQNERGSGNHILSFIARSLEPAKWAGKKSQYFILIENINIVLAFQGLEFKDDGKFYTTSKANTLSEAEKRAKKLRTVLEDRQVHDRVFAYCNAELLEDNYFHAVLEASKGVSDMIRSKTHLKSDGSELVDAAFGGTNPLLRINSFVTETEKSEQRGFVNLLKGLFGTFRNPTAHALRAEWNMSEMDALDLFGLVSYAYRRIDLSIKNVL